MWRQFRIEEEIYEKRADARIGSGQTTGAVRSFKLLFLVFELVAQTPDSTLLLRGHL